MFLLIQAEIPAIVVPAAAKPVAAAPQLSQARPIPTNSRPSASAQPVFKSIDESSEFETTQTDSDVASSPAKKDLFASLNLAESLDEGSHLLEVSESDQGLLAETQAHQAQR